MNSSTLRLWADRGVVRSFRTVGGHRRFLREDLLAFQQRAGSPARPSPARLGAQTLRRIRRGLHGERAAVPPWFGGLDEGTRGRLRVFGRRLLDVTTSYLAEPRNRAGLLEEVRTIGDVYGAEMARRRLHLRDLLEAFFFFRDSLLAAVRDTTPGGPGAQVDQDRALQAAEAVADVLLLSMADTFERDRAPAPAGGGR